MEGMESPELKVKEQLVSSVTRWHWASMSHSTAVTAYLNLFICLSHSHSVTMYPGLLQCLQSFPGLSLSHSLSYFRASLVAQLVKKKKKKIRLQCRKLWFNSWAGKIPWRRACQPTPVFLPGESHGQRSLADYSPWGCGESDTTEQLTLSLSRSWLIMC